MTLGQRIKQARKACGLSLDRLADRMGFSRQLVWQWELPESHPDHSDPRKHLGKLSEVLGVPANYFFGNGPPDEPVIAKIRLLDPDEKSVVEATVDAILSRRLPKRKTRSVK